MMKNTLATCCVYDESTSSDEQPPGHASYSTIQTTRSTSHASGSSTCSSTMCSPARRRYSRRSR